MVKYLVILQKKFKFDFNSAYCAYLIILQSSMNHAISIQLGANSNLAMVILMPLENILILKYDILSIIHRVFLVRS